MKRLEHEQNGSDEVALYTMRKNFMGLKKTELDSQEFKRLLAYLNSTIVKFRLVIKKTPVLNVSNTV